LGSISPAKRRCGGPLRKPRNESVKGLAPPAHGAVRRERQGDFTGVGIGSGVRVAASRGPDPSPAVRPPPGAMETAHEVAIYIDRFHNLDLFHQG
jgi:hypothetical protein